MAVAAYASLLSLTHLLHNLHYRAPFHLPFLHIQHVQTLQANVHFLLDFVELHSEMETPEIDVLWRHMAAVAFETEEKIDFHVVNLLCLRSLGETSDADFSTFCEDIDKMISQFDFINKELPIISEAGKKPSVVVPPLATSSSGNNMVVGFDEHMVRINDHLTRNKGHLQILSIVGMGGIGKTILAKCVYNDPYVFNYFDIRICVTISQQFSVQDMSLLLGVGESKAATCEILVNELGEKLYKELFGRTYLIIMDDMWSTEAWDELKRYFPDNGNGSRILVTTRISNVASCLDSFHHYQMTFLDGNASWDLFCQTTFAQLGCPYVELEKIGRVIAKSCRGLPLEISVIGCLLANSEMTPEYWGFVAENISSLGNLEDNEHCLKVLSLSYKSLPIHPKPCFLYMRVFNEDEDIKEQKLIDYWVAEGFIKPSRDEALEEIAKQYAKDLIDRNLIFIKSSKWGDESYGVHDLLRDFSLRESNKERFIQSPKLQVWDGTVILNTPNCLLCGKIMWFKSIYIWGHNLCFPLLSQDDNPIACDACGMKYSYVKRLKLATTITTIVAGKRREIEFPTELRFLALFAARHDVLFHQTTHLLWQLQILDVSVHDSLPLPSNIWEMPQLRHIRGRYFSAN